jgi:glycosyltransferase involved in cell wall biosynthesis
VSGYGSRTHREVIRDAHRRGIPVAMWSDSNLRSQRGRGLARRASRAVKRRFLARIIRETDLLLTTNSRGIAYWRYYGAPRGKTVLCPYYSDYARIDAARCLPRQQVAQQHGLAADDRILFTAARLVEAKGLDLAIKAFLAGNFQERGWRYLIAGTGPLEGQLKRLAGSACGKSIHILGFQQPRDNLALMAHADLFLLPSRYEPHGIVIAEAMAAGTPVLASDVCGAAMDLVHPGISGELFRSGSDSDLGLKLERLTSDARRLAAMRAGARGVFEKWFACTNPIKVVEREIGRLLAGPSRFAPAGRRRE